MPLREELLNVDPELIREAITAQLGTDAFRSNAAPVEEVIQHYRGLLVDYPALQFLFELLASTSMTYEAPDVQKVSIAAAGVALVAIKATANKQIFSDLQVPPDLE
jgi:hypothetical protein